MSEPVRKRIKCCDPHCDRDATKELVIEHGSLQVRMRLCAQHAAEINVEHR